MTADLVWRVADQLDRYQRVAARMYTLDAHAGRTFLREAEVRGATAALAARVNGEVPAVWSRFNELRRLTDQLPTEDLAGLGPDELAAVAALLAPGAVRLDADRLPCFSTGEPTSSTMDLAAFAEQVDADCARLLAECGRIDAACGTVADRAAAIERRLTQTEEAAERLGMSGNTELAGLRDRRARELAAALADPITAAAGEELDRLDAAVAGFAERVAGLDRIRTGYPDRLARLRVAIAELAAAERQAAESCALAAAKIGNPPVPRVVVQSGDLSAGLLAAERLAADTDWHGLTAQLSDLDDRTAAALDRCRRCAESAATLLDRRAELRGRFAAYSRKAARTGVIEEPAVSAAHQQTRELLALAPCDLPAATSALRRFQQAISG